MDGGTGSAVALCQLAEALSALPIPEDGDAVEVEWLASDVLTLELGPPHTGPHPLDDETPLKLGDDPDDDDYRPAQRGGGVDLFAQADELDVGRLSSSSNSREDLTDLTIRSQAQTRTTSNWPRRASFIMASSPGRRALAPLIMSVYSSTI
jgi:hypothetical protein